MAKSQTKPTRKLTASENMTRSSLFWLSALLFVALPFINNFLAQTVVLNVSGNIAYKDLAPVLSTAASLLSVFAAYAGIGVIAAAIAHFGVKGSIGTVILGILSHVAGLISYIMAYAVSGARNYAYAVFALGVDALANMLVYAVIIAVLAAMKKKRAADPPELQDKIIAGGGAYSYISIATVIFAAFQLASTLYTMVTDFLDPSIGTPINMQEWVYWITKYLTIFIYAGIGYLIVLGVFFLAKYYKAHFAEQNQ